jgi:hypothetical protein
MTTATETKPLTRPAAKLAPGDIIASPFLPHGRAAEVLHVLPYRLLDWAWVIVIHQTGEWAPIADHFLAAADIPLESLAADDGFGFSREPNDDPTPVSPARVPLHTGGIEGVATPTTVRADEGVLVTDGQAVTSG